MRNVLVIGSSGMAGHVVSMHLQSRGYSVTGLSRTISPAAVSITGDATNEEMMGAVLRNGRYDAVVNCAGMLNSDCDRDPEGAIRLNSVLPHFLNRVSAEVGFHLIHISTDCVFSGEGTGPYQENSRADGTSVYAKTKSLGEPKGGRTLVLRTSIVGPDTRRSGIGLLNWFMSQSGTIRGYSNAIWSGVSTITLARAVEQSIELGLTGLRHLTNGEGISKLELLGMFNSEMRGNSVAIQPFEGFRNDKTMFTVMRDHDYAVPSYHEMVREMAAWVFHNGELYPHYRTEKK